MPGLKAASCRAGELSGLWQAKKLSVCRVGMAVWLSSGQKVDCVPGWMTVWLLPGPESYKVEPSLGCVGLDVGGDQARIGWSGH